MCTAGIIGTDPSEIGLMVLPRTPIARSPYDDEEVADAGAAMDASLLPPG